MDQNTKGTWRTKLSAFVAEAKRLLTGQEFHEKEFRLGVSVSIIMIIVCTLLMGAKGAVMGTYMCNYAMHNDWFVSDRWGTAEQPHERFH